ncbi:MAG TPA: hypothetical protein VJK26_02200 [Patescibacteria group bacterium]|nr:hypothetical protein [Patescibacteria group bacterium]
MKSKTLILLVLGLLILLFGSFFFFKTELGRKILTSRGVPEAEQANYLYQIRNAGGGQAEAWVWDNRGELGMGFNDPAHYLGLRMARALGIRIVRTPLSWCQLEGLINRNESSSSAEQALRNFDYTINTIAPREGVELLIVVACSGNPPGISYANKEEGYQRFGEFMGHLAERYKGRVRYWQLFNEMDGAFTDLFGKDAGIPLEERGKLYAQMLKLAYPAIKKADSEAVVLTGGITRNGVPDFPRGIYAAGGKDYFDVLTIHTYGLPQTDYFIPKGQTTRALMNISGDGGKPLWATEFGLDAGSIQRTWNYPHNWSAPPSGQNGANLPGECSWSNLTKTSAGKLRFDSDGFDFVHCLEWASVIQANKTQKIYQKIIPYQFDAFNDFFCTDSNATAKCPGAVIEPPNDSVDDFGFGLLRSYVGTKDGVQKLLPDYNQPRPTYDWLKAAQVNQNINQSPTFTTDVVIFSKNYLPVGYGYATSATGVTIKNVQINSLLPTKIALKEVVPPGQTPSVPGTSPTSPQETNLPNNLTTSPSPMTSTNPVANFFKNLFNKSPSSAKPQTGQSPKTLTQSLKTQIEKINSTKKPWINLIGVTLIIAGLIYLWFARRRRFR